MHERECPAVTTRRSLLDSFLGLGQPRLVRGLAPAPREIAPGLWSIDRVLRMPGGPRLPVRSTLVRLRSGGLLVVAPPPVEADASEALEALGLVEEVLAPNSFHYLGAADCLARHPRALFRTVPGLHARIPGLPASDELTDATPAPWAGVLEHALLGPVRGVSEVALFHLPSATLILTDVAFHVRRHETGLERAFWRLAGVPAGFGPSRSARWILLRDRALARAFLERVSAWPFQRVLVAHGDPLEADAPAVFRKAFRMDG
jgi:hypothetical protein